MNVIKRFLKRRKFAKAESDAAKITSVIHPFINVTGELSSNALNQGVSSWSLSNKILLNYLGYVAGVIDAAEYSLTKSRADDWTVSEIVFHQIIVGQLDWIPGSEDFIKLNRMGVECGGSSIAGLQNNPQFLEAMKLGGNDFLSVGSPGFYPKGLFELGLVTGAKPTEEIT
ncbi:MAG TPA: hypothetical protein PKD55_16230 [Bellilinea sp.]|jgi:hypothetical protein|nr:hypothetical protein [Bellilinea sp.]